MGIIDEKACQEIIDVMNQNPDTLFSPNYIAHSLEVYVSNTIIMQRLHRMLKRGQVQRVERGLYQVSGRKPQHTSYVEEVE